MALPTRPRSCAPSFFAVCEGQAGVARPFFKKAGDSGIAFMRAVQV
jgi:hypothetical protein